jgi:regulator of protease activity HflC (stomatin/prohibitin superfamily)
MQITNVRNILKSVMVSAMLVIASANMTGCTRIETGEVGVRIDASKQIQGSELMPGSWNQVLVGDVLTFPVKDITLALENKNPLTADNSALSDFDVSVVYNINPNAVAEIYSTKAKSFHAANDGDIYLMYNYIGTLINNASYKSVRKYKSLDVADNRQNIEQEIKEGVTAALAAEGLEKSLTINAVQVRNVQPNPQILQAATEYVRSQNELKIKENDVKIAEAESRRMAALANNSAQSITFMQAQAALNISEGVKNGKVHTIVVPVDFKGIVNTSK